MNKFLVIILIVLMFVIAAELIYLTTINGSKNTIPAMNKDIPLSDLDLPPNQNYRLPNTPNRLTKFLTNALYWQVRELSDYEVTKNLNFRINTLYEGTITAVYQEKEAQKIHPPDPKYPKRTVVLIIDIVDADKTKSLRIQLVQSEIPLLTITDKDNKKLAPDQLMGRRVRYNRTIEFPLQKNDDIVRYDPMVYNQITVLN